MQNNANMEQNTIIKTCPESEVYKAILPSDGISLIIPKQQSKIDLARYLLDRLEKELKADEKNKKEQILSKR